MPRIFKVFEGELEHLDVEINMYDSEKVFELVANHDLHLGIIERLLISDQTETFPLFLDELVLAGNTDSETFFTRESGSRNWILYQKISQIRSFCSKKHCSYE